MTQKKESAKKHAPQNDFLHHTQRSKNPFAITSKKSSHLPQKRRFSRVK